MEIIKRHSDLSGWKSEPGGPSRNLVGPPGILSWVRRSPHNLFQSLGGGAAIVPPKPVKSLACGERGPFPALPRTYCQQFCSANSQGVSQDVYIRDVSVPVLQLERL